MTCGGCGDHVRSLLEAAGVDGISVDWRRGVARFGWPDDVEEAGLRSQVEAAGYHPGALRVLDTADPAARPLPVGPAEADYGLLILGAGSAAFAAAIRARDGGQRVALVEAGTLGGTCVNVGCVPSKTLLHAAELYCAAGHHPFAGLETSAGRVDLAALITQKDALVGALRQEKYANLVAAHGFEILPGHARFVDPRTVEVDGSPVRAGVVLIATGASAAAPPIPGLAEAGYLTSNTALSLEELPRRLGVIGGGFIGLELGQFFTHLGVEVTMFSRSARIASGEEPEVSDALAAVLRRQGTAIHAPAQITAVELSHAKRRFRQDHLIYRVHAVVDGRAVSVEVDELLVATGRRPNTEGLGLEAAGVDVDAHGAVIVDQHLRTTNPHVFAAGDVTPSPQYVYVSAYEGALAADNALLRANRVADYTALPRVTFTAPQLAAVGLTETQARAAGYQIRTAVLPLSAVPRAVVNRDTDGLVKLVAHQTSGLLLGASVLAPGAGDVIQAAVLATKYGITVTELANTFHPYLTMAEALKLAAQTFDRDVTKLSCCAA
jgi:mercuric reductase